MNLTNKSNKALNLTVYSLVHGLVDAACAGVILIIFKINIFSYQDFFTFVVLYNVIAFGAQAFLGLIVDKWRAPKMAAIVGCISVILAILVYQFIPILTFILAGLGNALFHIGGGTVSLNITPNRATAPGLFVAPGALGLFLGTIAGKTGNFSPTLFLILLIISIISIYLLKTPFINYEQKKFKLPEDVWEIILFLILVSVIFRSLVGSVIRFPWKADTTLLIILTLAVVLGKGLGGIIADKWGWTKTMVGALLVSAPLMAFGVSSPVLAIVGVLFFQMTMPVTLTATAALLPGRPAFAFGLTCLALIFGALPVFSPINIFLTNSWLLFFLIIIATLALGFGLKLFFKYKII